MLSSNIKVLVKAFSDIIFFAGENYQYRVDMNNNQKYFRFVVEKVIAHTGIHTNNNIKTNGIIKVFGHNEGVPCSATIMFLVSIKNIEPEWDAEKNNFIIYLPLLLSQVYFSVINSNVSLIFEVNLDALHKSGFYVHKDIPISRDLYQILAEEKFETF